MLLNRSHFKTISLFLQQENIKAFYLPLFAYPVQSKNSSANNKFIALINTPPKVENILKHTLKNFTSDIAAQKFHRIIKDFSKEAK